MANVIGPRVTVSAGGLASAGTGGILSNSRVVDMSDTIHLLDPNEAPLTALTMKLRTVSAINPKVEWMEDDYVPTSDATTDTVNANASSVTVPVTNGPYFRAGDILKVLSSGETLYVSSISSNSLTVIRTIGATAVAAIASGDTLIIIGNANVENSTSRSIITSGKTALANYCQIFRSEFGASGTLEASELYGGDDLNYQRKKAGKEFRIMLERSYLWGEKLETNPDTPPRTMDGLLARITTNVTNSANTLTIAVMEAFLRDGMRYGPARKMLFASRLVVSALSIIADNKIQTKPTDASFPLALTEYVSPHGKIYIATHNLLTGAAAATKNYGGWALLVDLDSVFHRPLQGRNTMLRTNIQANDADGRIDGYLAECCLQTIQEKNHAILNSITTAS